MAVRPMLELLADFEGETFCRDYVPILGMKPDCVQLRNKKGEIEDVDVTFFDRLDGTGFFIFFLDGLNGIITKKELLEQGFAVCKRP